MRVERRTRYALFLALSGPLLALFIHTVGPRPDNVFSPSALLYGLVVPIVPFVVLSIAVRRRRQGDGWRYRVSDIRTLGFGIASLILLPYVWWWFEYGRPNHESGGVNYALGCIIGLVPILLPFILVLGLALAAESSSTQRDGTESGISR